MNERVVPKMTNFCVVKLSNSPAKAGPMSGAQPMSEASALAAASALGMENDFLERGLTRIHGPRGKKW